MPAQLINQTLELMAAEDVFGVRVSATCSCAIKYRLLPFGVSRLISVDFYPRDDTCRHLNPDTALLLPGPFLSARSC